MTEPNLPQEFFEKWTAYAQNATIFGKRLDSLSREELLAVAAFAFGEVEEGKKQLQAARQFSQSLMRVK